MREIKFRAWDKWRNKMIQPNDGDFIGWHAMKNWRDCLEVMQFTGLKDKNGKEIYEGDIVEAPHDFGPGGFAVRRFEVFFDKESGSYQWNYWLMDQAEVIGNIYDNPELLPKD